MAGQAKVHVAEVTEPIRKGSIVIIAGDRMAEDQVLMVVNELRRIAGHGEFVVMQATDGSTLAVFGKEGLADAVRSVVKEEMDAGFKQLLERVVAARGREGV